MLAACAWSGTGTGVQGIAPPGRLQQLVVTALRINLTMLFCR
jgi:hypothetical protein